MEEYPDRAVSWFGVACYYLCICRYESARNYFGKATTVDASFAPAWLGFGHAFAAQDESDQASTTALFDDRSVHRASRQLGTVSTP